MDPAQVLPLLLGLATLLPLASFFFLLLFGPRLGKAVGYGGYIAAGAIVCAGVLSFASLAIWLGHHPPAGNHHAAAELPGVAAEPLIVRAQDDGHPQTADAEHQGDPEHLEPESASGPHSEHGESSDHGDSDHGDSDHGDAGHAVNGPTTHCAGTYYRLGVFGPLELTIGYYIDSLTLVMFCMVTLIASCIHFYAMGYMHEELHDVTDHEVTLSDGSHLKRPGRYYRFFQYLSLFSFSMLGLVLAGNIAMVFVFWELVGICSYFLIGFYIERKSACNAANKAFIVNRVGDFGMIIGLMIIWAGLGTFTFGDVPAQQADGTMHESPGVFSQVRPAANHYALQTPDGLVKLAAYQEVERIVLKQGPGADRAVVDAKIAEQLPAWRDGSYNGRRYGYGLLIVAGLGIFCGCVGKSAQFPLHVWLPDAMEGPTPVSALVHSATMVAAGVYLVGRFYPVFTPEVLLTIAVIGCITLFMAATIAITATDIKRVLAYSTVSQLGYMMLALGVGGWLAGLMHLVTHAFFKSLLFLCSGSVIHAVHTNEMPEMGGLRKKMPITAYTMLVGCLAIAGISIPFVIGFSGYYSKDSILEQAFVFMDRNTAWYGSLFFCAAAGGAAITAFYMFRMWYLTFAGQPRNQHRYDHAHESPKVMYVPLIILAFFATTVAWQPIQGLGTFSDLSLKNLLEASRPAGTLPDANGQWLNDLQIPDEHFAHAEAQRESVVKPVTWIATLTAWAGIALATAMYCFGTIQPSEVRRKFEQIYQFLLNKWWFDELYQWVFVRPVLWISRQIAAVDLRWIDGFINALATAVRRFAVFWERFADQTLVDGLVDGVAAWCYAIGVQFRRLQTGSIRQYVMFVVVGILALFIVISLFWSPSLAG